MATSGRFDLRSLYDALSNSVEVKDRKKNFKKFPGCFVGSEAVDYLVSSQMLSRRDMGIHIAQDMLDNGMIRSLNGSAPQFSDSANSFYVFEVLPDGEQEKSLPSLYPSMQEIFNSAVASHYFRQFVKGRDLVNFDFLVDATEFYNKHVITEDPAEVKRAALELYNVYFKKDSLTCLEGSKPVLDDVEATISYATPNIFERAILELSDVMKPLIADFYLSPEADATLTEVTEYTSEEGAALFIKRKNISFNDIVNSPAGSAHFMSFLSGEYCSETLKFYQDARRFATSPGNYTGMHCDVEDTRQAPAAALAIFERYIQPGSQDEVNIGVDLKNEIESKLSAAPSDLFHAASRAVHQLMSQENGPFSRFAKDASKYLACITAMRKEERALYLRKLYPSLRSLLKDATGVRYLRMYLETEFCAELLFCWEETQKFRENSYKLQTRSKLLHKNHARKIYSTFLVDDADNMVEVPASLKATVEAALEEPSGDMFVPLQSEVLAQMQLLWGTFISSALGGELANIIFH